MQKPEDAVREARDLSNYHLQNPGELKKFGCCGYRMYDSQTAFISRASPEVCTQFKYELTLSTETG